MYELDTNINAALERQAGRVRAVQAFGVRGAGENEGPNPLSTLARSVALTVAAAAPIIVIAVWGVFVR
jgi:hypothetical protein